MPPESHKEKTLGYVLLILGISLIVTTAVFAFIILTGKLEPPKVFNVESPSIQLPSANQGLNLEGLENSGIPPQLLQSLENQDQTQNKLKLLPDEVFSKLLNVSLFYLLLMFIASTGAKISAIGVSLVKEIKVASPKQV